MSTDEREELLGLAQIGLRTVLGEEGVDFVASLPVGHVGAKHAAIVARLIDENLGVELVFTNALLTSFATLANSRLVAGVPSCFGPVQFQCPSGSLIGLM